MNWGNLSSGLLGGIIGAVLATLGAWLIERVLWARDCRKQEWRQLLDAASAAGNAAMECGAMPVPMAALERLDITIAALVQTTRDRLFLPEDATAALTVNVATIRLEISLRKRSYGEIALGFVRLRDAVVKAARRDLGIAGAPRWLPSRRHRAESDGPDLTRAASAGK